MSVGTRPRVISEEEATERKKSIEDVAKRVHNWIKLNKVVPVANVKVESI